MIKERTILLLPFYMIVGIFATTSIWMLYYAYSAVYKEMIEVIVFIIAFYGFPIWGLWIVGNFTVDFLAKKKKQNQNINIILSSILEMGTAFIGLLAGCFVGVIFVGIVGSILDPNISGINLMEGAKYIIRDAMGVEYIK